MLTLRFESKEEWNPETEEFQYSREGILELEHSLVALSKWEQKYERPFLNEDERDMDETLFYIRCMMVNDSDESLLNLLTPDHLVEVNEYVNRKNSATWFNERPGAPGRTSTQVITSELIYAWMVMLRVPPEYQHWHLNNLMNVIKIVNDKNNPPKKMSPRAIAEQNRLLNEKRLAAMEAKAQRGE